MGWAVWITVPVSNDSDDISPTAKNVINVQYFSDWKFQHQYVIWRTGANNKPWSISLPSTPHLLKNALNSVGYPSACPFSQCAGQKACPRFGDRGQMLG